MQDQINQFLQKIQHIADVQGYYPRFVCDSRKVEKGCVFVALKGEKTDGHLFIDEALKKGAAMCVCSTNFKATNTLVYPVDDPIGFIQKVSLFKLYQIKPTLIGITGSAGKTSTKHFLSHILSKSFEVFSTWGNFNSQIGIPLALMSLEPKHQIAVIEMGMSKKGDIAKLRANIPLDYAIITSIGLAHAENFEDLDIGIAKAKGEILLNEPVAYFNEKTATYEPFSSFPKANIIDTSWITKNGEGTCFKMGDQILYSEDLKIDAPHLLQNLHLAIAMALKLNMKPDVIIKACEQLQPEKGRLEVCKKGNVTFIDDSYNASPSSMKAAILYLKGFQKGRKIALIGAMRELGEISEKAHLSLYEELKDGIDFVYLIGEETKVLETKLGSRCQFVSDLELLKKLLKQDLKSDDVVLIKGSHSTDLHTLLPSLEIS